MAGTAEGSGLAGLAGLAGLDDTELIKHHVDGVPDAFGELFRRHRDRLWAVALRVLGDPEDAADAVQDALVSAYRRADRFRGDAAVTTWLHRIVVNSCLDLVRRRRARPALAQQPVEDEPAQPAPAEEGPEATAVRHELRATVAAALAELPFEQRAALVLVDMEGYSVAEASEALGVPTGTVKSRCARGRARLLPALAHLHGNQSAEPGVSSASSTDSTDQRPERGGPGA